MARSNTGSTSNRFTTTANPPVTAVPLTLACWFNPVNLTHNANLLFVDDKNADYWGLIYDGANSAGLGDNVLIAEANSTSGGSAAAVSGTGGTAGAWMHCAGVFSSNTNRVAYLNGVGGSANTTSRTPNAGLISGMQFGGFVTFSPMNGSLAECAVWNVALTAAEIAQLADGYSPLFVRPNNLVRYWPLLGVGTETDLITGQTLTTVGTMAKAAHVPIIRPALPILGRPSAATAREVDVDASSYAITNTAVGLLRTRKAAIDAASYAISNTAITLRRGYPLAVAAASYTITPTAVNFKYDRKVAVNSATYSISNTAVSLELGRKLAIDAASYAISNTAINFSRTYKLAVDAAGYTITNTDVSLERGRKLGVDSATYAITPTDITLTIQAVGELVLGVDSATYSINGTAISLELGRKLVIDATSYAISNTAVSLERGRRLVADNANYTITASDVTLTKAAVPGLLSVESTDYTVGFSQIELRYTQVSHGFVWGNAPKAAEKPSKRKIKKEVKEAIFEDGILTIQGILSAVAPQFVKSTQTEEIIKEIARALLPAGRKAAKAREDDDLDEEDIEALLLVA